MELNYIDIGFRIEGVRHGDIARRLLALGTAAFAGICRPQVCSAPEPNCGACLQSGECVWRLLFGQELPADPDAVRLHQKPALPFTFSLPRPDDCSVADGTSGEFRLIVIGKAIAGVGMILRGVSDWLCATAGASLVATESRDYQRTAYPLDNDLTNLAVLSFDTWLEGQFVSGAERMEVRFMTPARLVQEGKPVHDFDIRHFLRAVLRRTTALAHHYAEYRFNCEIDDLLRMIDAVESLEESFVYRKGISGNGLFCGDFSRLQSVVQFGALMHVGKGASFGWGSYSVAFE